MRSRVGRRGGTGAEGAACPDVARQVPRNRNGRSDSCAASLALPHRLAAPKASPLNLGYSPLGSGHGFGGVVA